jgi:hypothetical protein
MDETNDIFEILKEEYGINSPRELNEAIERIGFIDMFPFCGPIKQQGKGKAS